VSEKINKGEKTETRKLVRMAKQSRQKINRQLRRDLNALAAGTCAALVFPREAPGCGNNEDLCAVCDARHELEVLVRRDDALKLARAVRHVVNGDPMGGWYCYQCQFTSRDPIKAAMHDGLKTQK